MFSNDNHELIRKLESRGFTTHLASNADEAKKIGLLLIGIGTAGFGGSATTGEIGIYDALKEQGNEVYSHTYVPAQEKDNIRMKASRAQWYLASTNAITQDGVLVNMDGSGNRVASMICGPENVLLFIGKNKLVKDVQDGMDRIKRENCPQNARRLHFDTLPCAITGVCTDCSGPQRMCRVTTIIEYVPRLIKSFHLVLIDEEIGW